MRLSALNYTIKYRPGRVHENADFLSRIALVSEGDDLTKSIREQQASDNICKAIIDYLDKGILTHENPIPIWAKEIDFFFIQNGILCRSNPPTSKRRRKFDQTQVVIPVTLQKELLKNYHDSPSAGHLAFV